MPERFEPFISILHIGIALLASGHIVLTKRDVRSAIGWIGLVWLSPFIGAFLYGILGINRIHRKARTLRRGQRRSRPEQDSEFRERPSEIPSRLREENLVSLARYMGNLTGRPLSSGNSVTPLDNGDEAYPAMIDAIDRASRSVGLASYIFNDDSIGSRVAEALGRAVARGVEVRVLVDAVGARYHRPTIFKRLRELHVRAESFLPSLIPAYFPYFNLRNHRKILVIDGREGFTGGMNIDESFYAPSHPRELRTDLHFHVRGPVVDTMRMVFADDWAFRTGEVLDGPVWMAKPEPSGPIASRGVIDGPDENLDQLFFAYLGALGCARHSVEIITPYFLPEAPLIAALNAAAMRGVVVDIFLPKVNNLTLVQWASTAIYPQVLEHGCRLWAVAPPFDHTKLMLVDRAWSFVGSGNWDPRSLRLNFEFNLECYDPELALTLHEKVEAKRANSTPITRKEIEGRSLPVRLRDGTAKLLSPYL